MLQKMKTRRITQTRVVNEKLMVVARNITIVRANITIITRSLNFPTHNGQVSFCLTERMEIT